MITLQYIKPREDTQRTGAQRTGNLAKNTLGFSPGKSQNSKSKVTVLYSTMGEQQLNL